MWVWRTLLNVRQTHIGVKPDDFVKLGKLTMNPFEDTIRILLRKAIGRRWAVIAAELSNMVGETVTESMLHEFTRARRLDRHTKKLLTAEWLGAIAKITGSHELEQYALCDDCRKALAVGKIGTMSQHSR